MKIFQLSIDNKTSLFLNKQKALAELEKIILSSLENQNLSEKDKFELQCSIEMNELGDKANLEFNNIKIVLHAHTNENEVVSLEMIEHNFLSTKISIIELPIIE